MFSKIEELLLETRKVPRSGKQRCIRLSSELDASLTEIAQAVQSIVGYNASVSHVSRMILEMYHKEILDMVLDKQESIRRKAFPIAATDDYSEPEEYDKDDDYEDDYEDLPDTLPDDEDDEESEEEYIRRMLCSSAIDTSSWEP